MELIVLGSGACKNTRRAPPGLALIIGKRPVFFDTGYGAVDRAKNAGINDEDVNYAYYTHDDPDHIADLRALLQVPTVPEYKRHTNLYLRGTPGIKEEIDHCFKKWLGMNSPYIKFEDMSVNHHLNDKDWKITSKEMKHGNCAIGYRIEHEEKIFVYSGDTGYCENIIELGENADLLVLECSYPNDKIRPNHLNPFEAGLIAKKAKAKKLALMHFYPACDNQEEVIVAKCRKNYEGPLFLTQDYMRIMV